MKYSSTILAVAAASAIALAAGAYASGHKVSGEAKKSGAMASDFTLRDFARYDQNGDGFLSKEELDRVPAAKRAQVLASDDNQDGRISKPEASNRVDKDFRMADPAGRDRGVRPANPAGGSAYQARPQNDELPQRARWRGTHRRPPH
jgi:hypothetical protein